MHIFWGGSGRSGDLIICSVYILYTSSLDLLHIPEPWLKPWPASGGPFGWLLCRAKYFYWYTKYIRGIYRKLSLCRSFSIVHPSFLYHGLAFRPLSSWKLPRILVVWESSYSWKIPNVSKTYWYYRIQTARYAKGPLVGNWYVNLDANCGEPLIPVRSSLMFCFASVSAMMYCENRGVPRAPPPGVAAGRLTLMVRVLIHSQCRDCGLP